MVTNRIKHTPKTCPCERINTAVVVQERKELFVGNDPAGLPQVINQCLLNVPGSDEDRELLKAGLHEILVNAIEHGNLEVTPAVKRDILHSSRDYYSYIMDRKNEPRFTGRKVRIVISLNARKLSILVEDEGPGFPWRRVLHKNRPPAAEDPYSPGGRGILIARKVFDEIRFNRKGNRIILVKYTN